MGTITRSRLTALDERLHEGAILYGYRSTANYLCVSVRMPSSSTDIACGNSKQYTRMALEQADNQCARNHTDFPQGRRNKSLFDEWLSLGYEFEGKYKGQLLRIQFNVPKWYGISIDESPTAFEIKGKSIDEVERMARRISIPRERLISLAQLIR